jgi:hypothetical protein
LATVTISCGISEEEFGGWAVKINAGITFIEYTLTFLVSMAALVTFVADRMPILDRSILGIQYRTTITMLVVGPRGPATREPGSFRSVGIYSNYGSTVTAPLPYAGTLIGIFVLASAAAASAQGLQNLALGYSSIF